MQLQRSSSHHRPQGTRTLIDDWPAPSELLQALNTQRTDLLGFQIFELEFAKSGDSGRCDGAKNSQEVRPVQIRPRPRRNVMFLLFQATMAFVQGRTSST